MRHRPAHGLLAAALLAIGLAANGCGTSTSTTSPLTPLDQTSADDLAMQAGLALNTLELDVAGAAGSLAGPSGMRPAITPFAALWDTTITGEGFTFYVSREFYDAQGARLPDYGPDAARMVWRSRIIGSYASELDTVAVAHATVLDFTGIQPEDTASTVSGTALDTLQNIYRSYDGSTWRYFHWKSVLTITDAVISRSREWPLSGRLAFAVKADRLRSNDVRDVDAHLVASVVITFNGTSQPDVVVNGVWHYRWDMQYGTIIRA